jgi:hypothetical protein
MTNIACTEPTAAPRGRIRRMLPLVAFIAATMLAGCVYPYPGGRPYHYGYYQPHPYYNNQWHGNDGWH